MPPPLSYPALKLVLEYLEAKKRYHITSRNSALQKLDKIIPLRVRDLEIRDDCVSLDNLSYGTGFEYLFSKWETDEELQELLKIHEAKEKLVKKYLEAKPSILVDCVGFYYMKSYKQVPVKLNLITNTLFDGENELIKGIEKLHRKKLSIHNVGYENVDAVKIINDWIKNGREVGTEYLLGFTFDFWMRRMLRDLKNEFDEFENDLEGINVRFLDREPRFLIPISPISKIIIYGTEIQSKDGTVYQLVLKVVSTDE
ncbi:hypothetical protein GCK72_007990 [Caenorhabditis remanei]|uniref:F-box associated domain-containing protein n=1 Tax=Caenorhabditis remanei TaxID=31234 RepID=A0A6A5HKK2_CAERE|nr:hypothetical protein GCK72_007990 [Caenorhabditis remanei]KAF1768029.1 hypothetical protein GCK72_007990 [Caenorhabditis remanei]